MKKLKYIILAFCVQLFTNAFAEELIDISGYIVYRYDRNQIERMKNGEVFFDAPYEEYFILEQDTLSIDLTREKPNLQYVFRFCNNLYARDAKKILYSQLTNSYLLPGVNEYCYKTVFISGKAVKIDYPITFDDNYWNGGYIKGYCPIEVANASDYSKGYITEYHIFRATKLEESFLPQMLRWN